MEVTGEGRRKRVFGGIGISGAVDCKTSRPRLKLEL